MGRIVKARGLKGEVKVLLDSEKCGSIKGGAKLYIDDSSGALSSRWVERVTPLGGQLISVKLRGTETREDSESIVGSRLYVPRAALPSLCEGEYYLADLIGAEVWNAAGERIGSLDDVMPMAGADVWIIRGSKGEILLPAIRQVILEVNPEEGFIIVQPLECV